MGIDHHLLPCPTPATSTRPIGCNKNWDRIFPRAATSWIDMGATFRDFSVKRKHSEGCFFLIVASTAIAHDHSKTKRPQTLPT